jgi:NACalpha-BTF3-like transcription factor
MKNPGTDSYVVFGDAKLQDFQNTQSLEDAAQQYMQGENAQPDNEKVEEVNEEGEEDKAEENPAEKSDEGEDDAGDEGEEKEEGDEPEETDLKEEDIEIVMSHTNCSR